jgi:hypothetical protein
MQAMNMKLVVQEVHWSQARVSGASAILRIGRRTGGQAWGVMQAGVSATFKDTPFSVACARALGDEWL